MTFLPTYFKMKYNYNIQKAGFLTLYPYLLLAIVSSITGYLADYYILHNIRILTVRKFCNSLGLILFVIFIFLAV